jgi:predicted dehydrogenase
MRLGILGCGEISDIYLKNLTGPLQGVQVVCCADARAEQAEKTAAVWGIKAVTSEALLGDGEIDAVLILTPPDAHYALGRQVLESGKHLYTEKPLATEFEQGRDILRLAQKAGLRVGCAPDTFLGAGLQTVFKAMRKGAIGTPVAASVNVMSAGHERWHPRPAFFYRTGGGPVMDMAPYSLTALLHIFGDVESLCAAGSRATAEREFMTGPNAGAKFPVEVDTFLSAQLRFKTGGIATVTYSFDTYPATLPDMEIYGTTGTLAAPDPNFFDGPVRLGRKETGEWENFPLTEDAPPQNMRGIGVADMAAAIAEGRPHKADGRVALHVLEIMQGILQAAGTQRTYRLTSTCGL